MAFNLVRRFVFIRVDNDVNEVIKNAKNTTRIRWSIPAMSGGISFEFDGIPIMSAGTGSVSLSPGY